MNERKPCSLGVAGATGFTLVEVMVASAIMMISLLAFTTMTTNQQRETKALSEKLAALDLQKLLLSSLSDSVCKFILTDPSQSTNRSSQAFDSTSLGTATISFQRIPTAASISAPLVVQVGQQASPIATSALVQSIVLTNFAGSPDQFTANFQVTFDSTKLIRPIKPLNIQTALQTDPTSPNNAKKITDCAIISSSTLTFLKQGLCSPMTGPDNAGTYSCPSQSGYQLLTYEGCIPSVARTRTCCYMPPNKGQGWCSPILQTASGCGPSACGPSTADYQLQQYYGVLSGTAEYHACCFAPVVTDATAAWCGPMARADSFASACPAFAGFTTQRIESVTSGVARFFSCCFFPN